MTVHYALVPGESQFTVQAFASGLLSMMAHNPTLAVRAYEGDVAFEPNVPAETAVNLSVHADSLDLIDRVSPADRAEIESRMREEVLETGRFPDIAFHSTRVIVAPRADDTYRLQIDGDMTIHGLSVHMPVEAELTQYADAVRLQGGFELLLSTFQMKRVFALGGLIKLKDDLRCAFNLVARLADTTESR